jgi:hypothetical protein
VVASTQRALWACGGVVYNSTALQASPPSPPRPLACDFGIPHLAPLPPTPSPPLEPFTKPTLYTRVVEFPTHAWRQLWTEHFPPGTFVHDFWWLVGVAALVIAVAGRWGGWGSGARLRILPPPGTITRTLP